MDHNSCSYPLALALAVSIVAAGHPLSASAATGKTPTSPAAEPTANDNFAAVSAQDGTDGALAGQGSASGPNPAKVNDISSQDIVVTATRRSESVQKVPAAITAVGGAELASRGIADAQGLQFAVPSLQVGSQQGITSVSLRGIGLNTRQGAPGVATYIDGVYQPRPALGDITQVDLQRVEVLRGPQGTLYGRNSTGGAITFVSNAPGTDLEASFLGGYQSYDEYHLQAMVNVPITGSWAVRGVVNFTDRGEGFIRNIVPGQPDMNYGRTLAGRIRLSGDITDRLSLDLEYAGQDTKGPLDYYALGSQITPLAIATSPVLASATVTTAPNRTTVNTPSSTERHYDLFAATLNWDSPVGEWKSTTSLQRYKDASSTDGDGTNVSFSLGNYRNTDKSFVQEVTLNSTIGPLNLVTGLFYMFDNATENILVDFPSGFTPIPPGGYVNIQQQRYATRSYAGYMDATLGLSSRVRLIGGARYSVDKQEIRSGTLFGVNTPAGRVPIAPLCPVHTDRLKFKSFTPRGGVQYDLSVRANVYGTVSRGFKAGGDNAAGCGNSAYRPEKITAYEIGFKSRLPDSGLTLNGSAFYYDYKDLQIEQLVGVAVAITNAASARVKGVELEGIFAPDNRLTLRGSISYLDAAYKRFSNIDTLNPLAGPQVLDGNRLNFSPKWSANGGVAYATGEQDWGQIIARADISYRSRTFFREFNLPLDSQAAYALLNLSAELTDASDRYSVRLFANNVTNKGYALNITSADTIGSRYVVYGNPRQFGAEFKIHFK